MERAPRSWLVCATLLATLASCKPSKGGGETSDGDGSGSAPSDGKLKLVVLIVIDQLPSWTFTRDAGQLEGGLGRLLNESVYFPEVQIPYANTYTAPGHATIGTGVGPNISGVMANGWVRASNGAYLPATADNRFPLYDMSKVGAGEEPTEHLKYGASSVTQRAEGVADVLTREKPRSRSVSLGLKQRAAILMLGQRATRAAWYESDQLAMTSSTFYGAPPAWLVDFNRAKTVAPRLEGDWQISDPEFVRRYTGIDDDSPGEGAGMGLTRVFPHNIMASVAAPKAFRMMPTSVGYLFDAARAAIDGEKLGQRGELDLLAITISSHDYVGHFWGQESWERFDMLRQIDTELGLFFDELDKKLGVDGYAVVLTSDHGAVPLVDRSVAAGRPARRIMMPELAEATTRGFASVLGKGEWVAGYAANSIYVNDAFKKQPAVKQDKALAAAVAELAKIPNVMLVRRTSELLGDCSRHGEELDRIVCESVHPEETGAITIIPDRFSLFQEPGYTTGTSHGTPSPECRQVPVLVRSPGVAPMRSSQSVTFYQVAPTLCSLLGISPPQMATGAALPMAPDPVDDR